MSKRRVTEANKHWFNPSLTPQHLKPEPTPELDPVETTGNDDEPERVPVMAEHAPIPGISKYMAAKEDEPDKLQEFEERLDELKELSSSG